MAKYHLKFCFCINSYILAVFSEENIVNFRFLKKKKMKGVKFAVDFSKCIKKNQRSQVISSQVSSGFFLDKIVSKGL